jgi:hypothetical protein
VLFLLLLLLLLLLLAAPAGGAGFTELAGYIFGGNSDQQSMEMTTPGGLFDGGLAGCALLCGLQEERGKPEASNTCCVLCLPCMPATVRSKAVVR